MIDSRLLEVAAAAIVPRTTGDPLDWFEANIESIPGALKAGHFDRRTLPWVSKALQITLDHETRVHVMMWGTQLGKSFTLSAASAYLAVNYGAPILVLQDVQKNADDFNLLSLRPLLAKCKPARELIIPENEKSEVIRFRNDSVIWVLSANNENNLQRRTIRYVIADEVWEYKPNRVDQVKKRVDAYRHLGRCVFASQGGVVGDQMDSLWNGTDQREWHFACPACGDGRLQPWMWEQVRFPEEARKGGGWDKLAVSQGTTYECVHCRTRLPDRDSVRAECNAKGDFVAMAPLQEAGVIGTRVPALAHLSWGKLGVEMLKASEAFEQYGDAEGRKIFKMKRLAMSWSEDGGSMISDFKAADYKMGEGFADVAWLNAGGRFVTVGPNAETKDLIRLRVMFVDKQKDRFYLEVRDFSRDGRSHQVHACEAHGWHELDQIAARFNVHPAMIGVDSGWDHAEVYRETAARNWKAMKGFGQDDFAIPGNKRRFYSEPERILMPGGKQARLVKFSNLAFKDMLYGMRVRKLFTYASDAPAEYGEHMDAEVRLKDSRTGKPMWVLPQGKENHYYDCAVGNLVLAVRWGVGGREVASPQQAETGGESVGSFPAGQ